MSASRLVSLSQAGVGEEVGVRILQVQLLSAVKPTAVSHVIFCSSGVSRRFVPPFILAGGVEFID